MGTCSICGKIKERVFRTRDTGVLICVPCRTKIFIRNPENFVHCDDCGRLRYPVARKNGVKPLCATCYKHYICKRCGKKTSDLTKGVCHECYELKYPVRFCANCGELSLRKAPALLCHKCWHKAYRQNKDKEICTFCNKPSVVAVRFEDGRISCGNCRKKYLASHNNCTICGEYTYTFLNKKEKVMVCGRCDTAIREGRI